MLLSIVIPTLNEENQIAQLVSYLKEHGNSEMVEIIVVNAEATNDQTAAKAQKAGAEVISCNQCRRSIQMNMGASKAKGNILYFVHADTLPPKQYYQNIRQALEDGKDWGCFSYQFDSDKLILKFNALFTRFNNPFVGGGDQTLFIRKSLFERMNGFREDFCLMEDFEFFKRTQKAGHHPAFIQNNVIVSARKYDLYSYYQVNSTNFLMFWMFWQGKTQEEMVAAYKKRLPKRN